MSIFSMQIDALNYWNVRGLHFSHRNHVPFNHERERDGENRGPEDNRIIFSQTFPQTLCPL